MYKATFDEQMRGARRLEYFQLQWGDAEMIALCKVIESGALHQLTLLSVTINRIGNAGMEAFATSLAGGTLPKLKELYLCDNPIGDAGVEALATACANGALPQLTVLAIDNPSEQLKAHCFSKGIKLN